MVGEFGVSLSGGQKQRIAIARNLFKNPDILIFDDSFSALDTGTDKKIREKLVSFQKNKSTLIISQRISTISHADEIIVLDEGNIVDRGKHNDLLEKEGRDTKPFLWSIGILVALLVVGWYGGFRAAGVVGFLAGYIVGCLSYPKKNLRPSDRKNCI